MERQVRLEDISDGRRYQLNDMVRAGCGDCAGCSACCHGMGASVLLDPRDIDRLCRGLDTDFESLLKISLELGVADGLILPHLRMTGADERCVYLNEAGRCSIHAHRPGFCRLFPLGRLYEDGGMSYILQIHECKKERRSKVRLRQWIAEEPALQHEHFVLRWHYFLKALQAAMEREQMGLEQRGILAQYLLREFYMRPYGEHFYQEFEARLSEAEQRLGVKA